MGETTSEERNDEQASLIKVKAPAKRDIVIIRLLITLAVVSMCVFVLWFVNGEHAGYTPLFVLLTTALCFKLVKMIHEWYHYWSVSVPQMPASTRQWKVDMLTTACPGEPKSMIIRTLLAMKAVTYPHTTYLCDEGDDPELRQFCSDHDIVHVTRSVKTDAKAGNINNALRQATGEICVVLDPDHVPLPCFLDRVLPYFEDSEIGFVQCVQGYGNQDESIVARGAAEQTYHFYGPMMMCMNTYGTVQAIGANCTFRRSALDSIGGHAAGLSEDMHTAMQLHAKGWKSVYVPEMLTRGLVPATLSSYYKQQLKWSRGTFELLFRTYPQLFSKFTWRQKLHYFTIPLYFLFGLINLIDILVPLTALAFAQVPWEIDLGMFAALFLPLCALSLVIRLYAQRWLLEEHERGFHFAGGVLRLATWWIFLIGFIYTIFKVKVPYIPTPKEDEHQNYWRLSIPNILVAVLSVAGVWYGLSIDWTPYSLAMAFYCLINAGMLSVVVALSQQKLYASVLAYSQRLPAAVFMFRNTSSLISRGQGLVYNIFRNGTVAMVGGFAIIFLSYGSSVTDNISILGIQPKEAGGFFTGQSFQEKQLLVADVSRLERGIQNRHEVISFTAAWNKTELIPNVFETENAPVPFIRWELRSANTDSSLSNIRMGASGQYLTQCAAEFRKFARPVFISFSANNAQDTSFVKTWQYLYTFFNNLGISNLTWVWTPASPAAATTYPGPKFTDWIGISCLNYGSGTQDSDWYTFSQLYEPYRQALGAFAKPVLITDLGSVAGSEQAEWFRSAYADIANKYTEVKGALLFNGAKYHPVNDITSGEKVMYKSDFSLEPSSVSSIKSDVSADPFRNNVFYASQTRFSAATPASHSRRIEGVPGHYKLIANGKPFYIKGVAYNTAHDWRDGNLPLTRRQVEKDFEKIKAMGANTLRRYDHGIYDRNVLNIAAEYDLRVLYGFWFDPKVDYYRDTLRVKKYMEEVEEKVLAYRDHPSVLAWSLGNETWGLLKHRFTKPYLTEVRRAYVNMIEKLARRIHELDTTRAVFSSIEHEKYQLPGELVAFRDGAPSVDVIGVNSYYREQISTLNHVTWQFDSLRPYLVSEFGPRGYWDPSYNRVKNGALEEDPEREKSAWYKEQWTSYVKAYEGFNIGGFAYCWHDRMEGTYTWFGLTDYKSRLKPAYHALKELWTSEKAAQMPEYRIILPAELKPGSESVCVASCNGKENENYKYEWYLLKDEYLERVDNVKPAENGKSVQIKVPEEASVYRLYLYVSDGEGNVTTASAAIPVR